MNKQHENSDVEAQGSWLEEVFAITKRVTGTKWMELRERTMDARNQMRERLAAQGTYFGTATAHAMVEILEKEIRDHADVLLSTVKELLDSSNRPLTKEAGERVVAFCDETFGAPASVLGPMHIFDEEIKRAYRGRLPSTASTAVRQKLKAAKGSAGLRMRVDLQKYLFQRGERLEASTTVPLSGRLRSPDGGRKDSTSMGLRVFLCHSSGDKMAIRELYDRLKADGYEPWLDEKNLLPGQDWENAIRRAVRESDVVIVCVSRGSTTKEGFVQKEIKLALDVSDEKPEETIFLIPARLEECPTPERLQKWHRVDLFQEDGYSNLRRALEQRAATLSRRLPKEAMAEDKKTTESRAGHVNDLAVGVRVGSKMHKTGGFVIQALVTNYTDRPVRLSRLALEWWLADSDHGARTKEIPLEKPLAVNAVDEKISINLSDTEAMQGDEKYSDLRELYAALHARIGIHYYAKHTLVVTRTDSFKVL